MASPEVVAAAGGSQTPRRSAAGEPVATEAELEAFMDKYEDMLAAADQYERKAPNSPPPSALCPLHAAGLGACLRGSARDPERPPPLRNRARSAQERGPAARRGLRARPPPPLRRAPPLLQGRGAPRPVALAARRMPLVFYRALRTRGQRLRSAPPACRCARPPKHPPPRTGRGVDARRARQPTAHAHLGAARVRGHRARGGRARGGAHGRRRRRRRGRLGRR
jgi:hypothetical protein